MWIYFSSYIQILTPLVLSNCIIIILPNDLLDLIVFQSRLQLFLPSKHWSLVTLSISKSPVASTVFCLLPIIYRLRDSLESRSVCLNNFVLAVQSISGPSAWTLPRILIHLWLLCSRSEEFCMNSEAVCEVGRRARNEGGAGSFHQFWMFLIVPTRICAQHNYLWPCLTCME